MDLRTLPEEERVLLAQFRLCSEQDKQRILDAVHSKAAAEKSSAAKQCTQGKAALK